MSNDSFVREAVLQPLYRQREYRYWFMSDTSLQVGVMVGGFAFTLLGYTVTHDYTLSGLVGTLNSLVQAFMIIPGGMIADRFDRRRLIVGSGICAAILDAILVGLLMTGQLATPSLLVVSTASGALSGLFVNVTNIVLPQIVDKGQLADATAANQSRDAVLQLAASPLSGLLYGISVALPFIVAAVFRVLQALCGMALRSNLHPHARIPGKKDGGSGQDDGNPVDASSADGMGEGLHWYMRHGQPCVVELLVVIQVLVLGMCGMTIVLDQQSRGTVSWMLGVIQACQGAGMLLGAAVMMRLVRRMSGRSVLIMTSSMFLVCFAATAFTHQPWILAVLGFCASVPLIPLNSMLGTYFILLIPNDLRGRVEAVNALLSTVASSVSSVAAGAMLDHFGYQATLMIPLAVMFVVTALACSSLAIRRMPSFERMDDLEPLA